MKKNQNGLAIIEPLLILVTIIILVALGWVVYNRQKQNTGTSQGTNSARQQTIKAKEGTRLIKMLPGITTVNLPSGDILAFNRTGSETSVPDFVFGKEYELNDIHNINYLPIKKSLETYSNGYKYKLTKKGCTTQRKFDYDIWITVVTSCTVELQTTKTNAPSVSTSGFTKSFSVTEDDFNLTRSALNQDPYLFVGVTNIRVNKTTDGTRVYSDSGEWEVSIISNYGIETIKYHAQELYAQQTKSVTMGPAKVQVVIDKLTCTPAYKPTNDCNAGYGSVYNKIDYSIKYSATNAKQDAKILDYQE